MLLLLLIAAADARDVLTGAPVEPLLREAPEPPPRAPVDWVSSEAVYTLEPVEGGLNVRASYRLTTLEDGWVFAPLLDGALMVTAASPGVIASDGRWWYLGEGDARRDLTVVIEGFLPTGADQASLGVAPAARQSFVPVIDAARELTVAGAVAGALPLTEELAVQWGPKPAPKAVTTVAQGRVATAATVSDDRLEVVARVRWTVRRGALDTLELRLPGEVTALEVAGPPASRWEQVGDRVIVTPVEPIEGASEVTLSWQVPLRKGAASLRLPEPLGVVSTESVSTLAGDGDRLIAPQASGPRVTPLDALPDWARGLGAGAPMAAWSGGGSLNVRALDVQPLDGPPLVVDAMRCQQAATEGGRSLLRCQLDVRNASQQFLTVDAPEGWRLWTARVNGDMVPPVIDGGSARVPLERSVETMEGLTTLDVDLVFQTEDTAWDLRGERSLVLPTLDAPVARLEWVLRLPPGVRGRRVGGSAREPDVAAGEIVYGFTASSNQALWTDALRAYQENRFEDSQVYLDMLAQEDQGEAVATNAARLQSNLVVLMEDKAISSAEEAQARRVKDLARAKVAVEEVTRQDKLVEVERQLQSGDVENALKELEKLEEENRQLSYVEQDEAASSSYVADQLSGYKAEAKRQVSEKSRIASSSSSKSAPKKKAKVVVMDESEVTVSPQFAIPPVTTAAPSDATGNTESDRRSAEKERGDAVAYSYDEGGQVGEGKGDGKDSGRDSGRDSTRASGDSDDDVSYRQRTEIDFDGVAISGELVKPEGALLLDRKQADYSPLIEIRGEFEMKPDADYGALLEDERTGYDNPAAGGGGGGDATIDFATSGGVPSAPQAGPLNQAPLPVPARDSFDISLGGKLNAIMEEPEEEEAYAEFEPEPALDAPPPPPPRPPSQSVSRGETLNKEFLERVPAGRSYQSAVGGYRGQDIGDFEEDDYEEAPYPDASAYTIDGANISDPVTGTFNNEAAEPVQREVLEKEFLDRVPTGRSYQSAARVLQTVPGVDEGKSRPAGETDSAIVSDPIEGTKTVNIGDVDGGTRLPDIIDDVLEDRREPWERQAEREARQAEAQALRAYTQESRRDNRDFRQERRRGNIENQLDFWRDQSEARKRDRYFASRETELPPDDWSPPRPLATTTFAIPLPDHGDSLTLSQRLLAPGEQAVVDIKYKQKRKEREK